MTRPLATAIALSALLVTPACGQAAASPERAEIEEIVREYILQNPEVLEEALISLAEKREEEKIEAARAALASSSDALLNDDRDFSIGPADAELTIVEFFDYRCGYCKASLDWIQELPDIHGDSVRVVFKELPILSPESEQAALAAIAAGNQGLYNEMHTALMKSRSPFKSADIDRIAEEVGLDVDRMRADMKTAAARQQLADIRALAQSIGASATPTFVIDGELVEGFNRARLEALIEDKLG
ncbi:MAG: DsbA family protein [Pseudomonadota bacterium]